MATYISHSPAETEALGEGWGRAAAAGWVIGLSGDLGTGKTQLVKGLARGLGISQRVHSPTFTLANTYMGGRLPLFLLDLYRLDSPEQVAAAGLDEFLQTRGVTVIEWAERLFGVQSPKSKVRSPAWSCEGLEASLFGIPGLPLRWVEITAATANERLIIYEDIGA